MPASADRLNQLPPYVFSVIGDRLRELQAQGKDIIRLDIGSPDMPPPPEVIDALHRSSADPNGHGYTGYRGTASFREAVADYYQRRFEASFNPTTEILPLLGSKEGLVNLAMAYLSDGDISLIPDIGYPSYSQGTRLAGGEIYWVPVRAEQGYVPQFDQIPAEIAARAKIMWVNYPNNPTGAVVDAGFYVEAQRFCLEHDILLVSDNAYLDVVYDGYQAPGTFTQLNDHRNVVELFSFTKSYNMAGWRLGVAVGDAQAIDNLLRVKSNVDSGHFKAIYDAGITALNVSQSWLDERNRHYQQRRDLILEALPRIGLRAEKQPGSLYVWAEVLEGSVTDYIEQALMIANVSLAPGGAYGPGGEKYLRISVGMDTARVQQALYQLEEWYSHK